MKYPMQYPVNLANNKIVAFIAFDSPQRNKEKKFQEIPTPANENCKIKSDWMTPAEALQMIVRVKHKLMSEQSAAHTLLSIPKKRRLIDNISACEQCIRWKYFRPHPG